MPRKRHTEEQIIGILKEGEAGISTPELCRKHGVSTTTYYHWKAKFGGMEVSDARRLRSLEDEKKRLKQLVANQALDIQGLKAINSKNF